MSRLSLEISRDHCFVADDDGRHTAVLDWPEDQKPFDDAVGAGQWLRTQLQAKGRTGREALLVVSRDLVLSRQLTIPPTPAAERPDVVRWQAATQLARPVEDLVLDFVSIPSEDGEIREVLLYGLTNAQLKRLNSFAEAADLDVQRIEVSSVPLASLVISSKDLSVPAGHDLVIGACHGSQFELVIVRDREVTLSRVARLPQSPSAQSRAVASEINRSLIAAKRENHLPREPFLVIISDSSGFEHIADDLEEKFDRVITLTPAQVAPSTASAVSAALLPVFGAFEEPSNRSISSIDFLNPRKAVVKKERPWLKPALIAGAACLVLGGLYTMQAGRIAALEEEVYDLQTEINDLDTEFRANEPAMQMAAALDQWHDKAAKPLQRFERLMATFPGTDRLYLLDLKVEAPARQGQNVTITGKGYAKDRNDFEDFTQRLADRGYRLHFTPPNMSSRDPDYPWEFQLQAEPPEEVAENGIGEGAPVPPDVAGNQVLQPTSASSQLTPNLR